MTRCPGADLGEVVYELTAAEFAATRPGGKRRLKPATRHTGHSAP